ncbi:hypothetical protein K04M3_13860 [Vibrio alginolyticus]|nr:hypothetical protein K04M3_13860 [Vibrio alginolyticus]
MSRNHSRVAFPLRYIKRYLFILIALLSLNCQALAAESYAVFSFNDEFSPLTVNKARKLYRGRRNFYKASELNSLTGLRHQQKELSSIVIFSTKI